MKSNIQHPTHNRVFTLNRPGYDPFIDFLKGICIIFVIINHCMPVKVMEYTAFFFWGVSAVPIFLIIQVFHAYKKGVNNATINYRRLWKKIIYPFLICELTIFIIVSVRHQHTDFSVYISDAISLIKYGGYGPGAYYPWIYIQFALILPPLPYSNSTEKKQKQPAHQRRFLQQRRTVRQCFSWQTMFFPPAKQPVLPYGFLKRLPLPAHHIRAVAITQ